VSYKYIERLYSDPEVKLVLHNVFVLLLKDEGAVSGELSEDGTGYAVSVENHYRTGPQKYGKKFVHFFSLIDLSSGMYVGCGMSKVSKLEAFKKALAMLRHLGIAITSLRLDKYFSTRYVIKLFERTTALYLIAKKSVRRIGAWASILSKIVFPVDFLRQYFYRNLSESGFSADKGRFGGIIKQRRADRQQTTLFSNALLHNIYTIRTHPK
jgi:transposase